MKLYELMEVTNECENMIVTVNSKEVARYDGRNSIPESLNECEVLDVSISNGAFQVEIECEIIEKAIVNSEKVFIDRETAD